MLEDALDDWIATFPEGSVERHTANLVAFHGEYFDYTAPIEVFRGPFCDTPVVEQMKAKVAEMARIYNLPPIGMCDENGTPPEEYEVPCLLVPLAVSKA